MVREDFPPLYSTLQYETRKLGLATRADSLLVDFSQHRRLALSSIFCQLDALLSFLFSNQLFI